MDPGPGRSTLGSFIGAKRHRVGDTAVTMELDWLETFLAVVDHGGFTAASEQVHRSQSRVSAHIAGLERELGIRLIDRGRRPARPTTAGEVFAVHARKIVAGVGSARSAVGALRALQEESIAVLTTACIGPTLFPGVLARLAEELPGVRVTLSERGTADVDHRFAEDGIVVAVLPTLARPLAPGLQEQVLWRERLQVVLPAVHPLARSGAAVAAADLAALPLVVGAGHDGCDPEALVLLAAAGVTVAPGIVVDTPQTVAAMVRAGVGVGVVNAVAAAGIDAAGLAVLDVDDPDLVREVAAYWYDVLVTTGVGKLLHTAVLEAEVPPGAVAVTGPLRDAGRG